MAYSDNYRSLALDRQLAGRIEQTARSQGLTLKGYVQQTLTQHLQSNQAP